MCAWKGSIWVKCVGLLMSLWLRFPLSVSKTLPMVKPKTEKQKEKIKRESKEQKRREKEERKKDKKREKEKFKSIQGIYGANKRKRDAGGSCKSLDKSSADSKEVHLQKKNEHEAEQLERSSLTEEYGQPIISKSPCYSSDGTQSKTKKSRIEQVPSNRSSATQGKVIRFKLKRREPEHAPPTDDIPSTSGRTNTPVTKMFGSPPPFTNPSCGVASVPIPVNTKESFLTPVEQLSLNAIPAAKGSDALPLCISSVKKTQKPKSEYESLFSEWVPPPLHFDAVEANADEQWLFPRTKQVAQNKGSVKAYDGLSGQQMTLLCPRAHLLQELDLYALPYTVPF